jgi:hypothetical protein
MKQSSSIIAGSSKRCSWLLAASLLMVSLVPYRLGAQTDSAKKTAPAPEAATITLSPVLSFVSIQKADSSIDLKTSLRLKQKGSSIKLPLLKVKFVLVTDTASKDLGFVITDRNGQAVLTTKTAVLVPDKEGKLHIKAIFGGNKQMEPAEAEVSIQKASLTITALKRDSVLKITAKLTDEGTGAAVAKATIGVFVKRSFYPMKIGEATTDENGEASVEIPASLPGDVKGDITVIARLDENETYGNVEASSKQPWGTAVSDKAQQQPRALWSTHPPLWMLFTFLILVVTVWGHYVVIIYELFRLRKEEPHPSPNVAG